MDLARLHGTFGATTFDGPLTSRPASDPDAADALRFAGKRWQDIGPGDWAANSGAVHAFTPAAFRYYFPAIVACSLGAPDAWFAPVDSMLGILDTSGDPALWDAFFTSRLGGWTQEEYALLGDWVLYLAEAGGAMWEDRVGRAFDTVDALRRGGTG